MALLNQATDIFAGDVRASHVFAGYFPAWEWWQQPYSRAIKDSNPLAWWRLGEPDSATSIADEQGTQPLDREGTGLLGIPGPISNDPDTAFDCQGTGRFVTPSPWDWTAFNDECTIECWWKGDPSQAGTQQRIMGNYQSSSIGVLQLDVNNDRFRAYISTGVSGVFATSPPAVDPFDGEWHHLVAMRVRSDRGNGDETAVLLFLDGDLSIANSFVGATSNNPVANFRVGGYGASSANPCLGMIDEAAVYDRTLSQAEVLEHYTTGLRGVAPEPPGEPPLATWTYEQTDQRFVCTPDIADEPRHGYLWEIVDTAASTTDRVADFTYPEVDVPFDVRLTVTDLITGLSAETTQTLTATGGGGPGLPATSELITTGGAGGGLHSSFTSASVSPGANCLLLLVGAPQNEGGFQRPYEGNPTTTTSGSGPKAWTQIDRRSSDADYEMNVGMFYAEIGGADPGAFTITQTFTGGQSLKTWWAVYKVTNYDPDDPIGGFASQLQSGAASGARTLTMNAAPAENDVTIAHSMADTDNIGSADFAAGQGWVKDSDTAANEYGSGNYGHRNESISPAVSWSNINVGGGGGYSNGQIAAVIKGAPGGGGPNVKASDDFGRADGPLGPNWTALEAGGLQVVSNRAQATALITSARSAWAAPMGDGTEAIWVEATLAVVGTDSYPGPLLTVGGSSAANSYSMTASSDGRIYLERKINGNGSDLQVVDWSPTAGAVLRLEWDPNGDLRCYVNGAEVTSTNDTTHKVTHAGLSAYTGNGSFPALDDFSAGDWR